MLRRLLVGDNERVFLVRNGRFDNILTPGVYWITGFGIDTERHSLKRHLLDSEWADFLVKERWELVSRHFTIVETRDWQVAVVYFDDKVSQVVGPGRRVLFWRGLVEVTYDVIDTQANPQVPAMLVPAVGRLDPHGSYATFVQVQEGERGLLYVDSRFIRELNPRSYAFWNVAGAPRVDILDTRLQTIEIAARELLTCDNVALSVNVAATYRIIDALSARSFLKDVAENLRRSLEVAVRQSLRKRTLQQVLDGKIDLARGICLTMQRDMQSYGICVDEVALRSASHEQTAVRSVPEMPRLREVKPRAARPKQLQVGQRTIEMREKEQPMACSGCPKES